MKQVLAELHSLINDLEDQGLTVEASSLQEVFVRVAQEADEDMDEHEGDLPKMVADVLAKHSVPEVIAEIANQMEDNKEGTQTMSFSVGDEPGGYGNEPKDQIIDNFVDQAKKNERYDPSLLKEMNDRLRFNGHEAMSYSDFLKLIGPKTSSFSFGEDMSDDEMGESGSYLDIPDNVELKVVPGKTSGVDEATVRQEIIEAWKKHVDAGNMQPYSAARMATQQLRMKFPEAKDITSTDIKPFKEFPGEDLKRVFQLGPQDPYKHWNTAPGL